MEKNRIGTSGRNVLISLAELMPSNTGMVTSMMIKSGFSSLAFSTASFPFEASPQTWIFGREERIAVTPILTDS